MLKPYFFVTWRHSSFACFPVFSLKRGILELTIILTVYVAIVLIKLVKKWCFFRGGLTKTISWGFEGGVSPLAGKKKNHHIKQEKKNQKL